MFGKYIRIFYCFQLCLLLILLIKYDITFALPNPDVDENIRAISNDAWIKIKTNPGKDKLNAQLLRNTRGSIMKSVFIVVGGVFILFIIGGFISIGVYYIKKK